MGSIRLLTEIPGPRSRALAARAASAVARPIVPGTEIYVARGEGAVLEDVDGNRYLDFIAGVGCLAVGHSHPQVVEAVRRQAEKFLHTDFSLAGYEVYLRLAERISERCGGGRKVALFNTGSEAVENAVKVARAATGRPGVLCFEGAFHGRTWMAMTLTAREVPFKQGFGPFVPEVYRAPYPNFGDASLADSLEAIERLFAERSIGAVVVEPVLGEGGFVVPPREFLPALAKICEANGAAFVADEVQSGYGRTGTFLASDQFGVRPDIVLLGKSIAAGLPLSAVVGDPGWMDAPAPSALGGTFPGNPVACAAAHAVLDVFEKEDLLGRAAAIGAHLKREWARLSERFGGIREVRGLGAMVGVEFEDPRVTKKVIEGARLSGVLAMSAGASGGVIRHLMPLITTEEQLAEAFGVFEASLQTAAGVGEGAR